MQIGNAGVKSEKQLKRLRIQDTGDNDIECIGCHTDATRTGMVTTSMTSAPITISGITIRLNIEYEQCGDLSPLFFIKSPMHNTFIQRHIIKNTLIKKFIFADIRKKGEISI